MKLSNFFGEKNTTNLNKTTSRQTPAQIAQMNRQIRSLTPGQTLTGEIVGRNGSEVQIKLSEDMVMSARIDQNMNMEIGKTMTFEVRANGSSLTLCPLFTNVSADVNVLKALDMAGLPVNDTTVAMTEQLMGAGLSVNRNFLLQVYREINNFPQGEMSDVINLHKLGLPVNEANMAQMESYRNLTHQLVGGMDTVLGEMSDVAGYLLAEGDAAGDTNLYQELFALVTGESASVAGESSHVTTGQILTNNVQGQLQEIVQNVQAEGPGSLGQNTGELMTAAPQETAVVLGNEENVPLTNIPTEIRMSLAGDVLNLIDTLQLSPEQAESLQTQMQAFASGQLSAKEFCAEMQHLTAQIQNLHQTHASLMNVRAALENLHKLFAKPEFKNLLLNELKNQWMLTPDEVTEPGKVGELYRKLDSQLKSLANVLEQVGQNESNAFKAVSNMSQNLDFLQQINQMYTYVQLPLKLQNRDANGELYVYANRKNLAEKKDSISALLHLDMEHLGPVDVYVALQNSRVNTKFYVRDEEMLDFLAQHMDLLTQRLKKRGYDYNFSMTTRENAKDETTEGGIASILKQEKGMVLSQYAFDVRT